MFKRNRWKRIQNFPFHHFNSPGVSIKGAIYWLGCRIIAEKFKPFKVICAFNSADEKFREVEQPECFKEDNLNILDVNVHGGCL